MNLPTLDKDLPDIGAGLYKVPVRESGEKKQRDLTSEECVKMFGARDAVMMNFVPQMLTALALEQAEALVGYCAKHKVSDYKRHCRMIRRNIDEYNRGLRKSYGTAWNSYITYLERLRSTVSVDLFKCWCTFTNEAARQFVGIPHKEIPARVTLIRMLFLFVEDFDRQVDNVISARLKTICHRRPDVSCRNISILCVRMARDAGHMMKITDAMEICVKVLANKCHSVVDAIMAEEDAEARAES